MSEDAKKYEDQQQRNMVAMMEMQDTINHLQRELSALGNIWRLVIMYDLDLHEVCHDGNARYNVPLTIYRGSCLHLVCVLDFIWPSPGDLDLDI